MPPPRDGVRGGRAMESRSSYIPPIIGLVHVPVGAESSPSFHTAPVLPTLDSHVGVHHSVGLRSEPDGVASG